jgi:hypothetical protein
MDTKVAVGCDVGSAEIGIVSQTIPRAVTVEPSSLVTSPPRTAELCVGSSAAAEVTIGFACGTKGNSLLTSDPASLVAQARK